MLVSAKGLESDVTVISHPTPVTADGAEVREELLSKGCSNLADNGDVELPEDQDANSQGFVFPTTLSEPEKIKLEDAATKAQAAFRGYLVNFAGLKLYYFSSCFLFLRLLCAIEDLIWRLIFSIVDNISIAC